MNLRFARAWILVPPLVGWPSAQAQGLPPATPAPQPTSQEWARLRDLVGFLSTEEGTRKVFASQPSLADAFSSADHFSTFVAPWRPRLAPLPTTRQEAPGVDVEVLQRADGTTACLMTFHHEAPANAITILKTLWQEDRLLRVVFMKGFSHVLYNRANRDGMDLEDARRYWRGATPAPTRSGGRR